MLTFIVQGLALGVSAAATPGSYQAFLINQTLAHGWRRSAIITFAPLVSDAPIVLLVLFLLNQLPAHFLNIVSLAGGLFALYLAWRLFRQWRVAPLKTEDRPLPAGGGLLQGILMNVLSPGPYTFWTLVNGPLLLNALRISGWHALVFLASFYGAFIGGMLVLTGLFHQARRLGPQVVRGMVLVSILILVIFGLILLRQGLSLWMSG